jgi:hypothetical protein
MALLGRDRETLASGAGPCRALAETFARAGVGALRLCLTAVICRRPVAVGTWCACGHGPLFVTRPVCQRHVVHRGLYTRNTSMTVGDTGRHLVVGQLNLLHHPAAAPDSPAVCQTGWLVDILDNRLRSAWSCRGKVFLEKPRVVLLDVLNKLSPLSHCPVHRSGCELPGQSSPIQPPS